MMDVRVPAAYYHYPEETDQNTLDVNAFFACIMNCLQKAHTMHEAVGYLKIPLGDYNHKWDKPCFHDIRTIRLALERLGNIIQGCLYENDIRTPVFDFQSQCGVKLVETLTLFVMWMAGMLFLSSCSIKEDRNECPCWMTVEMPEVAESRQMSLDKRSNADYQSVTNSPTYR